MRSLQDRYDVIYDWPSPTAKIPRAEARIQTKKSSPLHPCRLSTSMNTQSGSKAAKTITNEPGLWSCSRGNGRARVLAHLNMYGEYERLLGCLQVRYTDAIANGNGDGYGNGAGDDEQWAVTTIDAVNSWWGSYYNWGFHWNYCVQFRWWQRLGMSHECNIGWSDAGHSRSGDMEDGVTLDVPSFAFLFCSVHLYFFRSRPSTNDISMGYYHHRRQGKWRWCFPMLQTCQINTILYLWVVGLMGWYIRVHWTVVGLYPCQLLEGFILPRRSAPKEGENVTAWLHTMRPGPGKTCSI